MSGMSQFTFVGRIAKITPFEKVTKVRAIANHRRKNDAGVWEDDPHAVTLTLFGDKRRRYIDEHLDVGDLILARGRMREDRYEKDGEMQYEMSLIVQDLDRLARKGQGDDDKI